MRFPILDMARFSRGARSVTCQSGTSEKAAKVSARCRLMLSQFSAFSTGASRMAGRSASMFFGGLGPGQPGGDRFGVGHAAQAKVIKRGAVQNAVFDPALETKPCACWLGHAVTHTNRDVTIEA